VTLPLPLGDAPPDRESHSDAWYTPAWVLERVRVQWPDGIDLDPAWHPACLVKAKTTYTAQDDGLAHRWTGRVWNNPPYSSPGDWVVKARASAKKGAHVLQLVKFDPSTKWFQEVWRDASALAVFRRRLRFVNGHGEDAGTANFPCCLIYWAPWARPSSCAVYVVFAFTRHAGCHAGSRSIPSGHCTRTRSRTHGGVYQASECDSRSGGASPSGNGRVMRPPLDPSGGLNGGI